MRAHRRDPAPLTFPPVCCEVRAEHLYIHVPFCARRCVYCDFSIAVRSPVPVAEYLSAVTAELEQRHAESQLELRTVYMGGGTPSKLGGDGVRGVMDAVHARARIGTECEVTVEANPEDVSVESVRAWRDAGVNRVSLGVQSFDDAALGWMHRTHDSADARQAIRVLREEGGIENISIDLIFAMPDGVNRSWSRDLEHALAIAVPHLSIYGLTVEPLTPLGRRVARREMTESPEHTFEQEFLGAHDALTAGGFDHYEVSNYALPGYHSRHNWAYWQRKAYAGVGPSAHEFDGEVRRWNAPAYAEWANRLRRGVSVVAGCETLDPAQVLAEEIYLGLRTNAGLLLAEQEVEHVRPWIAAHWGEMSSDGRLCLTASGWLRLDSLAADLTHLRSR